MQIVFYCPNEHPNYKLSVPLAQELKIELFDNLENKILNNTKFILHWLPIDLHIKVTSNTHISQEQNKIFHLAISYFNSFIKRNNKPIYIDYLNKFIANKKCTQLNYNDALPKAMGLKKLIASEIIKNDCEMSSRSSARRALDRDDNIRRSCITTKKSSDKISILDGTAGFTVDSFSLLINPNFNKKIKITAVEHSPIIAKLIELSIQNYNIINSDHLDLSIHNCNFIDYLKNTDNLFDIIYLDPMFHHSSITKKTDTKIKSKPKQKMQLLQDICNNPVDTLDLLTASLDYKNSTKIVLKRDYNQPQLLKKYINYSVVTSKKTVRYDIYLHEAL